MFHPSGERRSNMDTKQLAMEKHRQWKGKIEVISRALVIKLEEFSVA